MAVKLLFNQLPTFLDSSGNPYNGAKLFFYAAGSSTKQTVYQDSLGNTAHSNPITLNSKGQPPAPIWGTAGLSYKMILASPTDSDPPAVALETVDGITGINDASISVDEWASSGLTPTYVSATSFTLSGDQTTEFHEGRRLKITDSGGTKYCSIVNSAFGALTTVTVAGDSLASPTSAVSYSLARANNPSISPEMLYRKGASVASAATCDIWNTAGDFLHVTGNTGPITSFGTAPYAGAQKTIIFDSTPTITHNATSLVLPGGANITAAANDRMVIRADTTANMVVVDYIKANGRSVINTANTQPTRQVFTSGSGTYTTPAGVTRIFVRLVGGGAGGGGAPSTAGANGGDTTFSTLTGGGGTSPTTGNGAGGTAAGGSVNIPGGSGQGGINNSVANVFGQGGQGGGTPFGGGGGGGQGNQTGANAPTNSGGGGGGGGGASAQNSAGGGGGGGYVEAIITSPSATYSYGVGAGGAGGVGASLTGGNGAAGIIVVDEFYD